MERPQDSASFFRVAVAIAALTFPGPWPARGEVVIEAVAPGSSLGEAGARAGDVLSGWQRIGRSREEDAGSLKTPFAMYHLQIDEIPRGGVELRGRRGTQLLELELAEGGPEDRVRPAFPVSWQERFAALPQALRDDEEEDAVRRWRQMAAEIEAADRSDLAAWIHFRLGQILSDARRFESAQAAFDTALGLEDDLWARIAIIDGRARAYQAADDDSAAEATWRESLARRRELVGEGLQTAFAYDHLGTLLRLQDRLEEAAEMLVRAVELRRREAPRSLAVAASLNHLGTVCMQQNQYDAAALYFEEALRIQEEKSPRSSALSGTLRRFGNLHLKTGDLDAAEAAYRRSLALARELDPGSMDVAVTASNLGNLLLRQGDLAAAEAYLREALAVKEELAPESRTLAITLNNLSWLAKSQGDLVAAEKWIARAAAIFSRIAPQSSRMAGALVSRAHLAWLRKDLESAESLVSEAYELVQRLWPDSQRSAEILHNLANVKTAQDDFEAAAKWYRQALGILEATGSAEDRARILIALSEMQRRSGDVEQARQTIERARLLLPPDSSTPLAAHLWHETSMVAGLRRRWDAAIAAERRAIAAWEAISADAYGTLDGRFHLARMLRQQGRVEAAAGELETLLAALDGHVEHLGGSSTLRMGFRSNYRDAYRLAVETLLELERPASAFHVAERFRAREILDLLSTRDLVFRKDLPPELERRRRRNRLEYDRLQRTLWELGDGPPEQLGSLREELRRLRQERDEVAEELRRLAPRRAALHFPRPVDARQATAVLDPGTVALVYSLGSEDSTVFVLERGREVAAYGLTLSRGEVELEVSRFLSSLERPAAVEDREIRRQGRHLYDHLVRPAAAHLARAERLLILPDGALYRLPFSALVAPRRHGQQHGHFLIESLPIHTALSMTVYRQMLQERARWEPAASVAASPLIAFGDPSFHADELDAPHQPLPSSREEVERIAALFPGSRVFLGPAATETAAKNISGSVRRVHFATHAWLEADRPLDSALMLSTPGSWRAGDENGVLQVWEVFEQLRFDADLVVLSACGSGLGPELGGEGLIGLTTAFHHAGARTVASTLWNVADRVTVDLMERFYAAMASGSTKDQALREAQLSLLENPVELELANGKQLRIDASSPYFWAAFQVSGDWR